MLVTSRGESSSFSKKLFRIWRIFQVHEYNLSQVWTIIWMIYLVIYLGDIFLLTTWARVEPAWAALLWIEENWPPPPWRSFLLMVDNNDFVNTDHHHLPGIIFGYYWFRLIDCIIIMKIIMIVDDIRDDPTTKTAISSYKKIVWRMRSLWKSIEKQIFWKQSKNNFPRTVAKLTFCHSRDARNFSGHFFRGQVCWTTTISRDIFLRANWRVGAF